MSNIIILYVFKCVVQRQRPEDANGYFVFALVTNRRQYSLISTVQDSIQAMRIRKFRMCDVKFIELVLTIKIGGHA